ncbi:hypothetical protein [Acidiphilium sp.]|uniref:hypothetical protein n=1 Tax=Acidiphilium sp. TaxID=527 RepID=UPI003D01B304
MTYIERNAWGAVLVEPDDRTEYAEHGGLLCRVVNLCNGAGDRFFEVCSGLRSTGGTVPVQRGGDVADILRTEAVQRFGRLQIRDAQ